MAVTYEKNGEVITRTETFEAPEAVSYEVEKDSRLAVINSQIAELQASLDELNAEKTDLEAL